MLRNSHGSSLPGSGGKLAGEGTDQRRGHSARFFADTRTVPVHQLAAISTYQPLSNVRDETRPIMRQQPWRQDGEKAGGTMNESACPDVGSPPDAVRKMDLFLGSPDDAEGPFTFRAIVEAEEHGELPAGAVEALHEWGWHGFLVPVGLGGRLHALDELFSLARTLSRRNLTPTVMWGSALLGANPIWLWGDDDQKKLVADAILGGSLTCFGLSEENHGSDLSGCETRADRDDDALVLQGEKWPIGNATRSRFVTLYAKTSETDFSLLLVDKETLEPGSWSCRPLVKTVGLRGHDLSGIAFNGARIPMSSVLGCEGSGQSQALKTLQFTRILAAAMSLGTVDSTLRIAFEYSRERILYGSCIYEIPVIREHVVNGHIDLLISECVALPVTRAFSIAPARLSLWSSVVKYLVPVMAEKTVASMGTVLGARSFLREGVASGIFQKLQRDHAVVSIFEGTTHINLLAIARQLPFVLKRGTTGNPDRQAENSDLLRRLFTLSEPAPRWEPRGSDLQLTNRGHDEITQGWQAAVQEAEKLASDSAPDDTVHAIVTVLHDISRARKSHYTAVNDWNKQDRRSTQGLVAAELHCVFHAAASCLHIWLTNRLTSSDVFADGGWLLLCLQRLARELGLGTELSQQHMTVIEAEMLRCLADERTFSLLSLARKE